MSSDMPQQAPTLAYDQGIDVPVCLSQTPDRICVALVGERSRFSLRVPPERLSEFCSRMKLNLPTRIGASSCSDDLKTLCLGPDEWLIVCDQASAPALKHRSDELVADMPFSFVDISSRHVAFKISGAQSLLLLNGGCPLDLSIRAFPVGKGVRTIFEHVELVLLRQGETSFYVEVWRSFALYFLAYLEAIEGTLD